MFNNKRRPRRLVFADHSVSTSDASCGLASVGSSAASASSTSHHQALRRQSHSLATLHTPFQPEDIETTSSPAGHVHTPGFAAVLALHPAPSSPSLTNYATTRSKTFICPLPPRRNPRKLTHPLSSNIGRHCLNRTAAASIPIDWHTAADIIKTSVANPCTALWGLEVCLADSRSHWPIP